MHKSSSILFISSILLSAFCGSFAVNHSTEAFDAGTAYDERPMVISKDRTYSITHSISLGTAKTNFVQITDSDTESTMLYDWGFEKRNGIDQMYLQLLGGDFDTRCKIWTSSGTSIEDGDGVMFYVDASEPSSRGNGYVGVGVGFILMNTPREPRSSDSLWDREIYGGNFNYYYGVEGRTAYYFDYDSGSFKPTSIIDRAVTLREHYKGWCYIPYSSIGWNGTDNSARMLLSDGFVKGYKYVNYTHIICNRMEGDDTQSKVYMGDVYFVKAKGTCSHNYVFNGTVEPTCQSEGYDVYKCSLCDNIHLGNHVDKLEHSYTQYVKHADNEAFGICENCDHVEITKDSELIKHALYQEELSVAKIKLHYGFHHEFVAERAVKKGKSLARNEMIKVERTIGDSYFDYDFISWSEEKDLYSPLNPETTIHNEDKDYYAKYLIENYDNIKYSHVPNLLAKTHSLYDLKNKTGQIIMNGNSNFALAWMAADDFKVRGLPSINNAVAGGSTYDYLYYADPLVVAFKPKVVLFNLTTNDQAYWSMSEVDIYNTTVEYIEYIHQFLPDCVFCAVNASPLPGRSEMFATVERLNARIKKYASTCDYVEYIDTYDFVYERMMEYPEGWEFWTHMESEVLSTWFDLMADGVIDVCLRHNINF